MSIKITNLQCGGIVINSLVKLTGEVSPSLPSANIIVKLRKCSKSYCWPIYSGYFKVLVELENGVNDLEFVFLDNILNFSLHYNVPLINNFVRPVYIMPCDDDGEFQGPSSENCSATSAVKRISFGAKLIQDFISQKLKCHKLGSKTFLLESDLYPEKPTCHIFKSNITTSQAHKMTGSELWVYFAKELMGNPNFDKKENCKWFAFMSFTRYLPDGNDLPRSHSDILRYTKGHTALGGGGLALFGTGNLHTWAEGLDDVLQKFTDNRKINRKLFMDDSAYRQTYWGNYSTGLGSALHELCHTFDLAHTPTGIMARGFDDLYKVFTIQTLNSSYNGCHDSHNLASPVPYSPRHSPVNNFKKKIEANTSPNFENVSQTSVFEFDAVISSSSVQCDPAVIQIEPSYERKLVTDVQTFTINNYDQSKTIKTITKHIDGTETISEITHHSSGERVIKEIIRNLNTGRARTTMSMSSSSDTHNKITDKNQKLSQNENFLQKLNLNTIVAKSTTKLCDENLRSPSENCNSLHNDGGANLYRASAVILSYHKWMNPSYSSNNIKAPVLNGNLIESSYGLRLIELRTIPDSVVFHHWEFLHKSPPTSFLLKVKEILNILSHKASEITIFAMDDFGNILKKNMEILTMSEKN